MTQNKNKVQKKMNKIIPIIISTMICIILGLKLGFIMYCKGWELL